MAIENREMDSPPLQEGIRQLSATPEGKVKAPPGWLVTDTAGNLYVKQSAASLNTGWKLVTVS